MYPKYNPEILALPRQSRSKDKVGTTGFSATWTLTWALIKNKRPSHCRFQWLAVLCAKLDSVRPFLN
jgi:hypothetical protein